MPDREMEERHLVEANRLIDEGETRVAAMQLGLTGMDIADLNGMALARETLTLALETLQAFREHRILILQALAELGASGV